MQVLIKILNSKNINMCKLIIPNYFYLLIYLFILVRKYIFSRYNDCRQSGNASIGPVINYWTFRMCCCSKLCPAMYTQTS